VTPPSSKAIQLGVYDVIQAFQGERTINTFGHVKDLQVEGDGVYMPPNG
jgi:hypothetical protein